MHVNTSQFSRSDLLEVQFADNQQHVIRLPAKSESQKQSRGQKIGRHHVLHHHQRDLDDPSVPLPVGAPLHFDVPLIKSNFRYVLHHNVEEI